MNYAAHYERLIQRARGRVLTGYRERHHVLPKCIGGGNEPENIVELTPEEHYVAHQLLVKLFPAHGGLAYAALKMAKKATGRRPYGWLRRRVSEKMAVAMVGGSGNKGRTGIHHSSETCAKMSATRTGMKASLETRTKLSAMQRLREKATPETRAKMSESATRRDHLRQRDERGRYGAAHSSVARP